MTQVKSIFPDEAQKEIDSALGSYGSFSVFHDKLISDIIDNDRDVPPISDTKFDPYSEEYKNKVLSELRLDENKKLSGDQRTRHTQLEALICRYAHVFMLPGAPFKGVDHDVDIDTGDSQPQYTPPYLKSSAQLQIIKEEIQKMIEQDILKLSNLPWGAPCI